MSHRFEIGPGLSCDLDLLIPSRMLVQANSGQGKTRLARSLLNAAYSDRERRNSRQIMPCDGLSVVVERDALKGYGNAIVPQVAAEVIAAYMEICDDN
jgi:hypothetical protein